MQIIFGRDVAEQLQDRYVVLELETYKLQDREVTSFCVVPSDKIPLSELADLDRLKRLHQCVADCLRQENFSVVLDAIPHLIGKFGGEVDSFYSVIEERINGGNNGAV